MTSKILYVKITTVARKICWRGSMAEQLICNQQVDGSTPFASSNLATNGRIANRQTRRTVTPFPSGTVGSAPTSPTKKNEAIASFFFYPNRRLGISSAPCGLYIITRKSAYHHNGRYGTIAIGTDCKMMRCEERQNHSHSMIPVPRRCFLFYFHK